MHRNCQNVCRKEERTTGGRFEASPHIIHPCLKEENKRQQHPHGPGAASSHPSASAWCRLAEAHSGATGWGLAAAESGIQGDESAEPKHEGLKAKQLPSPANLVHPNRNYDRAEASVTPGATNRDPSSVKVASALRCLGDNLQHAGFQLIIHFMCRCKRASSQTGSDRRVLL